MLKKIIIASLILTIGLGLRIASGQTSDELEKYRENLKAAEKAIEINADDATAWNNKGFALKTLGRYEEALKAYDKAIEINPQFPNAWNNKGVMLEERGELEEAISAFDSAIEIDSTFRLAWKNKAAALEKVGKLDEAVKAYEQAIDLGPKDAQAWTAKGIILRKLGKYKEALKAHWKAQEIDPEYPTAWNNSGVVLHTDGKYYQAYFDFRRAIKIDSTFRLAWKNIGGTCVKLGKYDKAAKAYERAADLSLESERKEDEQALYNMGRVLVKLGRYGEALDPFRRVTKYPDSASAHTNLGQVFLNLGNLFEARKELAEARNIEEDHAAVMGLKGRIEIEEEEYDSAIASYGWAIRLDSGNPLLLLRHAYAKYLKTEFSLDSKGEKYQRKVLSIVRDLERAEKLSWKPGKEEIRAHTLYFLGCFYHNTTDLVTAKEKLEECIGLESSIRPAASELLRNIWNHQMRPSWWRWWLHSPICGWKVAFAFVLLAVGIVFLFVLPFIKPTLFSSGAKKEIKTLLYILYVSSIGLLVIGVVSPSLKRIKAKEIEIELRAPLRFESVLSPAMMELMIGELEDDFPK